MPLSKIQGIDGQVTSNLGRRNMIINGAMQIAQRATSGTPIDTYVSLDRFRGRTYGGSGRFTMEQVSGGDGGANIPNGEFPYAMKLTVTTAASSVDAYDYSIAQPIEADTFARLGWGRNEASESLKSCTVSFLMKTSVAGVYSVSMRANGAGRSIVKETPSITANTWTKVILTFVGDNNTSWRSLGNGVGCLFEINLGRSNAKNTSTLNVHQAGNKVASDNQARWIGTNGATFFITGLQIEEGDSATEFEHRSKSEDLALCQRYLYKTPHVAPSHHYHSLCVGFANGQTDMLFTIPHPVTMRGNPTFTSSGSFRVYNNGTVNPSGAITLHTGGVNQSTFLVPIGSGNVSTRDAVIFSLITSTAGYLLFDAEI